MTFKATEALMGLLLLCTLASCASTSSGSASGSSHCLEELSTSATGAPTIELLADAVDVRSERRIDQDAMRVVVRAPRHVSLSKDSASASPRQAAMSQLLRAELTTVLADRWKLIDDPVAASPLVTHELQADFGEVEGDVALSVRLVDVSSAWVIATARGVVPMEEMPFLAAMPAAGVDFPTAGLEPVLQELAEPAQPLNSEEDMLGESGVLIEQLAGDSQAATEDLTSQVITEGQLRELVGPAARRLGQRARIEPR